MSAAPRLLVPRLLVEGVSKSFPGVLALQHVTLAVQAGEIHAICGENGAGKSTLVKIIAGVYAPDEGRLELDGAALLGLDEARAGRLGIGIVHQEGSLVPTLSVAENVFAGHAPTGPLGTVDRRRMNSETKRLLSELRVDLDPNLLVSALSTAEAQAVEIAKALSHDLRLLILDEPTAALSIAETGRLFDVARHLASRGVAILYISHRLAEIFELCDRVTVLKDGRLSGTRDVAQTTRDELIHLMVGREVLLARADAAPLGEPVLEVEHVSAPPHVRDASLSVRAGEIVCLAGLIGSGRSELCEAVFGARPRTGGRVRLLGRDVDFRHPQQAMRAGVGMVPEDRKEAGLFLDMSVEANLSAANLEAVSSGGVVSERKNRALAQGAVQSLRIATPSIFKIVGGLSGGNQQKVLLAKWLSRAPRLLIVDEPTRGVDVGARAEIYRVLRELAANGVALLVVSSDLPEVLTLAGRVVVMREGVTVGEMSGDEASELAILNLAALSSPPAPQGDAVHA